MRLCGRDEGAQLLVFSSSLESQNQMVLVSQSPHHPPRHDQSAHKHGEAVQTVAELVARIVAHGDAENDRGEN